MPGESSSETGSVHDARESEETDTLPLRRSQKRKVTLNLHACPASEAITRLGPGPYQLQILLLAGGVYAAEGCALLILSVIARGLIVVWELPTYQAGAMAAILFAGLLLGTSLGGLACDRCGRRLPVLVTYGGISAFFIAGIASPSMTALMIAKFFLGFFLGFGVPASNALVAESCPSNHRSNIYCMTMILFSSGQMYAAGIFWLLSPSLEPEALYWKTSLFLAAILPAALLWLSCLYLPESVHWLLAQGRVDEAKQVLAKIHRSNNKLLNPFSPHSEPRREMSAKEDGTESEDDEAAAWASTMLSGYSTTATASAWDPTALAGYGAVELAHTASEKMQTIVAQELVRLQALFSPKFNETTMIMIYVAFASNFAYYGMIWGLPESLQKAAESLEKGGGDSEVFSPATGLFISALCEIPGVVLAVLLGLTIGRRANMSFALGCCSAFLLLLVYAMSMASMVDRIGIVAVIGVKFFLASGYIIVYLYLLECYPTQFRATGLAFCMVFGRMGAGCCPPLFELLNFLGMHRAWFFATMAMLMGTASYAVSQLPYETKDAELFSAGQDSKAEVA